MPPIQLSLLLHHVLDFFKRVRITGDKLWKLSIRQTHGRRLSMQWDEANHRVFDGVHCFRKFPTLFSLWRRSQSLPLHYQEHYHPEPQIDVSISHPAIPSNSPTSTASILPISSSSSDTRAEDDDRKSTPPGLSETVSKLVGVTSCEFERYERNFKTEEAACDSYPIPPLRMTFTEPKPPNLWVAFNHPDGALYFFDDSRKIPILTDVWIYDAGLNDRLEDYIRQIFSYIDMYGIEIPMETCLVLEFRETGRCGYYFVNHEKQCIFWLDEYNGVDFLYEVKIEYTPSLVGHAMKSLYWAHCHLFPNIRPLPSSAIPDIQDILIHAIGDSLTSEQSLAPYKLEALQSMLELVSKIQEQETPAAGSIAIISRFLQNFYKPRFLHLHGQKMARLNRNQAILPERPRTILMKIISPLLLYGAEVYLKKLREISVDYLVNIPVLEDMLGQLTDEWKEFTLYATVLLNANVAFLAIQSVDSSGVEGHRSDAQRASYFSIVHSIGAIVLGLLLVRQHSTTLNSTQLIHITLNRRVSVYGLETLALMYSLPYALLMWGMVAFLMAFSFMCFGSQDRVVMVVMSITWLTLCSLLLWCISVPYESQDFSYLWQFRQWGLWRPWFNNSPTKEEPETMVGKLEGTNMHTA